MDEKSFIVDFTVSERNVIAIYIDSFDGMTIDRCISVSRHVEHSLDRDEEDFELQVSSPGLTETFKVKEQYVKYVGKAVEVSTVNGIKLLGTIQSVSDNGFILETSDKEKVDGQKKKILVVKQHDFKFDEIKGTKAVISFK